MDVVVWKHENSTVTQRAGRLLHDLRFIWDTYKQQYIRISPRYRDTLTIRYYEDVIFFQCKRKKR